VNVSPLGIGIEVGRPLSPQSNWRVGFNTFHYTYNFQIDGVNYSAALHLASVQGLYDRYLTRNFHLSPGLLLYNGNRIHAKASVPGGQNFSINGISYVSAPSDPINGTGKLSFFPISPMILAGFGNIAPRNGKHVSFRFQFGGVYQGTPSVGLNLAGTECNPGFTNCMNVGTNSNIQSDIQFERKTAVHDASRWGLFPIVSLGIAFKI
jgi:hypothetical protein